MDEKTQQYLKELREWFQKCQDYYQDALTVALGGQSSKAPDDSGNAGPPPPPPPPK